MSDDFEYWLDDAPVISARGSNEFAIWLDGAPVVESDVTSDVVADRRRVMVSFID